MDFIRTSRPLIAGSVAALSLGASAEAQAARPASRKNKRPDVIFIMTDQQTARAMSCAGNPWLSTPNMDALAADGVRFDRAYCPFPLSGPCRSSRAVCLSRWVPTTTTTAPRRRRWTPESATG